MNNHTLPSPTKNAGNVVDICGAIVADIASLVGIPGNTLVELLRKFKEKKLKEAAEILLNELKEGNIAIINDRELESFIPNAYRFFEAAQYGEYIHNLRILARLLIDDLRKKIPDVGKIGRMSRRLQSMSVQELQVLVAANNAFNRFESSSEFDGYHLCINDNAVLQELGEKYVAPATRVNSCLSDLVSRGFLFVGGDPRVVGGHFYYKTHAFDEVISEANSVFDATKTAST